MAIGNPVAGTILQQSVGSATWNVAYPASVASTDVLELHITAGDAATAIATPSGWTSVGTNTASGATTPRVAVFIKAAVGGETGTLAVTMPSAASTGQATMTKTSGVDQSTPLDVTATTVSLAATTAYTIPTLTTVTAGCMIIGYVGSNTTGAGTFLPPTTAGGFFANATELTDTNTVNHSSIAYAAQVSAGATGGANFVRSGSVRGAGVLYALRPAATAPALPIIVQPPRR